MLTRSVGSLSFWTKWRKIPIEVTSALFGVALASGGGALGAFASSSELMRTPESSTSRRSAPAATCTKTL